MEFTNVRQRLMRASLLVLVCCLGFTSTGLAQDWARAMFDGTSHDFGVVARGAKVEHHFVFQNIYLEDVRIASVTSSCRCTLVTFPKQTIKTYEKAEIVATVDTRRFLARKDATLKVVFAEPFPAEVQLHTYCYIRSDVVFEPGEVRFGSVPQGSTPRKKVTVSYAGRNNWQVLRVEKHNPSLDVQLAQIGRQQGLVTYNLWVGLKPDAPAGYIKDHLTLVTNDRNQNARQVLLPVEGVVVPSLSARPSPLPLGVLEAGQTVHKTLVVVGLTPFRVVGACGPDDRFRVTLPQEAKTVQLIPVTFTAGDTPGEITGKVRVETDLAGNSAVEVDVTGRVLGRGSEAPPGNAPDNPSGDPSAPGGTQIPDPTAEGEPEAETP